MMQLNGMKGNELMWVGLGSIYECQLRKKDAKKDHILEE